MNCGEKCVISLDLLRGEMMKMLNGIYRHSLDAKGRMAVPAKFRTELGDKFYVTRGDSNCLFIFSSQEWVKFNEAIRSSLSFRESLKISRHFNAFAFDVEPDSQGRIILPQELRNIAGIDRQAVVVGASSHAEVWSPEKWEASNNSISEDDVLDILEKINFI